jgi:hypothetical protein
MGAIYNALSLDEVGVMANAVEQLGLSNDETCLQMRHLVTQLEIEFAEHVQEYVQHAAIAKQSIRYWYMKQAQLEMIGEALVTKQTALHTLLKTEGQAERLQATMIGDGSGGTGGAGGTGSTGANTGFGNENGDGYDDDDDDDGDDDDLYDIDTRSIEDGFSAVDTASTSLPSSRNGMHANNNDTDYPTAVSASALRASRSQSKKWTSPRKLLNAMSYTIQGMMDVDPESTRRNQIDGLRAAISQVKVMHQGVNCSSHSFYL